MSRIECTSRAVCDQVSAAQVELVIDMTNIVVPTLVGVMVLLLVYDIYRERAGVVD
jgi:hypothetical protein